MNVDEANSIFKDLMVYLSYHSNIGIIIVCVVLISIYLAFSIRLLLTTRDVKMDLYALCFIPGVNIIVWIIKNIKNKKRKKMIREVNSGTDISL